MSDIIPGCRERTNFIAPVVVVDFPGRNEDLPMADEPGFPRI